MMSISLIDNMWVRGCLLGGLLVLAGCERPPMDTVQHGYRGTGMAQVYNPRILEAKQEINVVPESPPAASADGPKAGEVYSCDDFNYRLGFATRGLYLLS